MSRSTAARNLCCIVSQNASTSQAALRVATPAPSRPFSSSAITLADEAAGKGKGGLFKSLLHGSQSAKEDGLTAQSHSTRVGRGKYIHEIQRHVVRPEKVDEYIALLANYYPKLAADQNVPCRLIGSWQVYIGECETFCKSSMTFGTSADTVC